MTLALVVWIYALGWFLYAAWLLVGMYRRGDMKGMEEKFVSELKQDPEAMAHYEKDVHGIRTKMRIYMPALPILLAFMLASVWPLVVLVRLSLEIVSFVRRDRD